jgi:hypothetical protein
LDTSIPINLPPSHERTTSLLFFAKEKRVASLYQLLSGLDRIIFPKQQKNRLRMLLSYMIKILFMPFLTNTFVSSQSGGVAKLERVNHANRKGSFLAVRNEQVFSG